MKLIAITGKKYNGKDSVADVLCDVGGYRRVAFADHLKWLLMMTYDLSFEQLYGDLKEVVDPRWGFTPRECLQRFGTEVGRNVHPLTWIRKALDTIERARRGDTVILPDFQAREFRRVTFTRADHWVVTDCRFPDEVAAIRDAGGVILKVVRPSIASIDGHVSETNVDEIREDRLILNDGTLEQLGIRVKEYLRSTRTTMLY